MTIFGKEFWSFDSTIEGVKCCKLLIQIYGTHLYRKYKDKMWTTLFNDANGNIFPLAFAIIEGKNVFS